MKAEDYPAFVNSLVALFAAFGREPTEHNIEAYWQTLEDYRIDHVQQAVKTAMRASRDHPASAGRLREIAQAEARFDPAPTPARHAPRIEPSGDERIDALRRGFRMWPVGGRERGVVRERLSLYGYQMSEEEFAAPSGPVMHQFGHLTETDETKDEQRRKAAERESV